MEQLELLRPLNMLDNLVRIIIDDVYTAVLNIIGLHEPDVPEDTSLEITRPIEPADLESPVLLIHCSARHCCIGISSSHGASAAYRSLTSQHQKNKILSENDKVNTFHESSRLHQTSISVLPRTIHLSRVGAGRRNDHWRCTSIRPDVANLGALGILETVRKRLDAAILCQQRLRQMAKTCNYRGPKLSEICRVLVTLKRINRALDLETIKRTRCQKRGRVHEITGPVEKMQTDEEEADSEPEIVKRMRTLRVF